MRVCVTLMLSLGLLTRGVVSLTTESVRCCAVLLAVVLNRQQLRRLVSLTPQCRGLLVRLVDMVVGLLLT